MRVSFSIFLLGWWMVKQRRMSSGQSYRKPFITVSPSTVVALGENVTIHCTCNHARATFILYKQSQFLQAVKAASYEAVFPIAHIEESDQGIYVCIYCFLFERCSESSDRANIQLAAQVYPKPFISVDASGILTMGESTNIRCNSGNQPHTDFYLYKEGTSLLQKVKNVQSSEVVFHFTHAQQADGGIYRCTYCFNSNSGKQCSNFSNNIYINITDPSLTIPTISVEPRRQLVLDSDITIECRGPENGLNFSLHKGSDLIASQMSEPGRNTTTFALSMKRLEDAGNYTCQYHHRENPFVWSGPSDPVELLVTEPLLTIIWASCAAGLLLVLLLLWFAFVLYRKRRKGPKKNNEKSQVIKLAFGVNAKADCDESTYGTDLDGITYAVLNQNSLKIKQTTVSDTPPCIYAAVAINRNRECQ